MAPIIARKRNWPAIMLFVIVGSALLVPSDTMSQDLSATPEELSRERFEDLSKGYSLSQPVLEALFEEHKEFFGKYGNALKGIDFADKFTNNQKWDFVKAVFEEVGGELLKKSAPALAARLNAFKLYKDTLGLAKGKIFDPYFKGELLEIYCLHRKVGSKEYAFSVASAGKTYFWNTYNAQKEKFKQKNPHLTKKSGYFGVELLPVWEPVFEELMLEYFEEACQEQMLKEAALAEKAELKKKQAKMEEKIRELLEEMTSGGIAAVCNGKGYNPNYWACCDGKLISRRLARGRVAGSYDADWGGIRCEPPSGGKVECKYSEKDRWSLHLHFEDKKVDDGRNKTVARDGKLVGRWDHNDGKTGAVEFDLNACGEITGGMYGHDPKPAEKIWNVRSKKLD